MSKKFQIGFTLEQWLSHLDLDSCQDIDTSTVEFDDNNFPVLNLDPGNNFAIDVTRKYCQDYLQLGDQLEFMKAVWEEDTEGWEDYIDEEKYDPTTIFRDMKESVRAYIADSTDIHLDLENDQFNDHVPNLDAAFEMIPEITEPITVYRVYQTGGIDPEKGTVMTSDRYLSTSLSQTFVDKCFASHSATNVFVRIDIMPGMKVLPVLNYEKWGNGGYTTEFEILLPRNACVLPARVEFAPEYHVQKTAFQIVHLGTEKNTNDLFNIDWHFIVAPEGIGKFKCYMHDKDEDEIGLKCKIWGGSGGDGKTHSKSTYKGTSQSFDTADDHDMKTSLSQKIINFITSHKKPKNNTSRKNRKKSKNGKGKSSKSKSKTGKGKSSKSKRSRK